MNASEPTQVPRKAHQVTEHRGDQGVDAVLQELCSKERPSPRNTVRRPMHDERVFETFIGGARV
jgi:hypothetical protein